MTFAQTQATKILEEAVLTYVSSRVLDDSSVDWLVERTNAVIRQEAMKPVADGGPLKKRLRQLTQQRDNLLASIANESQGDEVVELIKKKAREFTEEIKAVNTELNKLHIDNKPIPALVGREEVLAAIGNLREVLNGDPAVAGLAIRGITGPIRVTHELYKGKKGANWTLKFVPRLAGALAARSLASADAFKLLEAKGDRVPEVVILADKRRSEQERVAVQVAALNGSLNPVTGLRYTVDEIAAELGVSRDLVYVAGSRTKQLPTASE